MLGDLLTILLKNERIREIIEKEGKLSLEERMSRFSLASREIDFNSPYIWVGKMSVYPGGDQYNYCCNLMKEECVTTFSSESENFDFYSLLSFLGIVRCCCHYSKMSKYVYGVMRDNPCFKCSGFKTYFSPDRNPGEFYKKITSKMIMSNAYALINVEEPILTEEWYPFLIDYPPKEFVKRVVKKKRVYYIDGIYYSMDTVSEKTRVRTNSTVDDWKVLYNKITLYSPEMISSPSETVDATYLCSYYITSEKRMEEYPSTIFKFSKKKKYLNLDIDIIESYGCYYELDDVSREYIFFLEKLIKDYILISPSISTTERLRHIAKIHWYMCIKTPNMNGGGCIGEVVSISLMEIGGILFKKWKKEAWFVAITSTLEEFVEKYSTIFEVRE